MRALDSQVVDPVWAAIEAILAQPPADEHPLGCHSERVGDRDYFDATLTRLVTGRSWVRAERLTGSRVCSPPCQASADPSWRHAARESLAVPEPAGGERLSLMLPAPHLW